MEHNEFLAVDGELRNICLKNVSCVMSVRESIKSKIQKEFDPIYLDVVDESHRHHVPESSESHFKVLVVSEKFRDQSRIDRQRSLNELLREELAGPIHGLAQKLLTPKEWETSHSEFKSPDCVHRGPLDTDL